MKTRIIDAPQQLQEQTIYSAFCNGIITMKQASALTGIDRANICWYVWRWEKDKKIYRVEKKLCPVTKHRATFYTADRKLWRKAKIQAALPSIMQRMSEALAGMPKISIEARTTPGGKIAAEEIIPLITQYCKNDFVLDESALSPEVCKIWNEQVKPIIDEEVAR